MAYVLILSIHADPAMPPGYSEWGGTHTYMRELLDSLDKCGIECVLITRKSMEELPSIEQYNPHCKIYRLQNGNIAPIDKTRLREYHDANVQAIQGIVNDLRESPMAIHSVYWNSGRIGMVLAEKYNVPLVHSVISNSRGRQARGAKEPVPDRATYEQEIYNYSKWILCVSNDEKDDLVKLYDIPSKKIIVAGQYIHPSFIVPSHDSGGFPRLNSNISVEQQKLAAFRYNNAFDVSNNDHFWAYKAFTYFGRIDESKGVDHILVAWYTLYQKYNQACPPLWLIGGSIHEINLMRQKCQHLIPQFQRAEQENKIVWWGCIDSIGASTLLLKTLVLVTNSLYEPGGRVITEAMSEGVPVIASPNGFALDLVRNWENGFLVSHGNETELAIRMEHFIRQPFLSNVLGENARQTATNVIEEWDFINKHIQAYGIDVYRTNSTYKPFVNYYSRREINLFPYRNIPFSEDLLSNFLYECTGENTVSPPHKVNVEGTSDIYYIQGNRNSYIIKHPYTRMSISPMVSPIRKYDYTRSALDFYNYEVSAYRTSKCELLVGQDDFHQLLLLRKLDVFVPDKNKYPAVLDFLSREQLPLSEEFSKEYDRIIKNSKLDTIEDIEVLFSRLSARFPEYYFEPSGGFFPHLGWMIAPHLIEYNKAAFSDEQIANLESLVMFFSNVSKHSTIHNWCEITSDVTLKHIVHDNDKMHLIDREKRTVGIAEYVIADFLLDLYLKDNENNTKICCYLLRESIPSRCNVKHIIESLAYKLFYKFVLCVVLRNGEVDSYLDMLKYLQELEDVL